MHQCQRLSHKRQCIYNAIELPVCNWIKPTDWTIGLNRFHTVIPVARIWMLIKLKIAFVDNNVGHQATSFFYYSTSIERVILETTQINLKVIQNKNKIILLF